VSKVAAVRLRLRTPIYRSGAQSEFRGIVRVRFVEVLFRCVAQLAIRNHSFAFSRASFSPINA
jgi:hypothetical protein